MAAADPCEGTSGETDDTGVYRLGKRETVFDLKEIILRIVTNTSQVNLLMFSRLTCHDDAVAYSEMALNAADTRFNTVPGCVEQYACDENAMEQFIKQCMISNDQRSFCASVKRYVLEKVLLPQLKCDGAACVRRLYSLTKRAAERLTPGRNISIDNREEICHMLIEGINGAFEGFEETIYPEKMKRYVNVWHIDYLNENGEELSRNPALEGADLVKYLMQQIAGVLTPMPQLGVRLRASLVYQRAMVRKIVEEDSKANPKNEETTEELMFYFDKVSTALTRPSSVGKHYIVQMFAFDIQEVLVSKNLVRVEHGYASQQDFFIIMGRFIKRMCSSSSLSAKDATIYNAICEATAKSIEVVKKRLVRRFGENVWINL